jgi:hypothetical protein
MIIWKGAGFIVAVIAFASLVLTEFLVESLLRDEKFYQHHGWPKLVAFVAAALIVYPIARYLDAREERAPVDPATGKRVVLKSNHSLFFVSVRTWPIVLVLLGFVFLFVVTD